MATLPSVLFLVGGVVTYFVPLMTPPLYIAGSVFMFVNAVGPRLGSDPPRRAGPTYVGVALRLLAVSGVVLTAFWSGYFL